MTMNKHVANLLSLTLLVFFFFGCNDKSTENYDSEEVNNQESQKGNVHEGHSPGEHGHEGMDQVHLSAYQLQTKNIS
jgi:hypothetical protein